MEWVVRALLPSTTLAGLPNMVMGVLRALQMELVIRVTCLLSSERRTLVM